ncbi:MAG: phosphotransferase [bacterium]
MSTIKTKVNSSTLKAIIAELSQFLPRKPKIVPLKNGEISQAYLLKFRENDSDMILRINSRNDRGFFKDDYASRNFSQFGLKIPGIIINGQKGEYYFSLSEKCAGHLLDEIPIAERRTVQTDLFRQLLLLFKIAPMGSGYGRWDKTLQAENETLAKLIRFDLRINEIDMIARPFSDLKLQEAIRQLALPLGKFLPEERYLIHGDPGFQNACCENGQITGLFDWAESAYRDFVSEIAWLMFWNSNALDTSNVFLKFYQAQPIKERPKLNFENYEKRLQYALLVIGYGSLCFFAKSEQPESYQETVEIMRKLKIL